MPGSINGLTALHVAAGIVGDVMMVDRMLALGARPLAKDAQGRTAAEFARECAGRHPDLAYAAMAADFLDEIVAEKGVAAAARAAAPRDGEFPDGQVVRYTGIVRLRADPAADAPYVTSSTGRERSWTPEARF
eukprot:gene39126-29848_t